MTINAQEVQPFIGTWWSPAASDDVATGFLEVNRDSLVPLTITLDRELGASGGEQPLWGHHLFGSATNGDFTVTGAYPGDLTVGRLAGKKSERWHGARLIHGAHVAEEQLYKAASFRLPGLWFWFGPSSLNGFTTERFHASKDDEDLPVLRADLPGGFDIALTPSFAERWSGDSEAVEKFGVYVLRREDGFTLEELDRVTLALQRLHACITDTPMDTFDVRLFTSDDASHIRVRDIGEPEGAGWARKGLSDPFFDTAEIDFSTFIPAWVELSQDAMPAVAAAAPREDRQFLSSELIELCNGIETLAVMIMEPPVLDDADQKILEALKDAKVNSGERRRVSTMLRRSHSTLADKLRDVAALLGPSSADWLLGNSIDDWAHVVMRLRNAIAHGLSLPNGMADDLPALIAATRSCSAVLRLAIFRHAGYVNPLSDHPEELLHSAGSRGASHTNSDFYKRLGSLAGIGGQWGDWRSRLES